ncbi:MAG: hypothetical protein RR280_08600 [Bacteroidaceae bacterium]
MVRLNKSAYHLQVLEADCGVVHCDFPEGVFRCEVVKVTYFKHQDFVPIHVAPAAYKVVTDLLKSHKLEYSAKNDVWTLGDLKVGTCEGCKSEGMLLHAYGHQRDGLMYLCSDCVAKADRGAAIARSITIPTTDDAVDPLAEFMQAHPTLLGPSLPDPAKVVEAVSKVSNPPQPHHLLVINGTAHALSYPSKEALCATVLGVLGFEKSEIAGNSPDITYADLMQRLVDNNHRTMNEVSDRLGNLFQLEWFAQGV